MLEQAEDQLGSVLRSRFPKTSLVVASAVLAFFASVQTGVRQALAEEPAGSQIEDLLRYETAEEQRIRSIEHAFLKFGEDVLKKLDQHVADVAMREKIRRMFSLFHGNAASMRRRAHFQVVYPGDEGGFGIYLKENAKYAGRFNGIYRTMVLDAGFECGSIINLAQLVHETMHVFHDDAYRARAPWARYVAYYQGVDQGPDMLVFVLEDEAEAIAVQLEVLNIATNGAFKAAILGGAAAPAAVLSKRDGSLMQRFAEAYWKNPASFYSVVLQMYLENNGARFDRELRRVE